MKLANILIGFFALLFFGVQLFNIYDGITHNNPEMIVSALYFISIGLFMAFNLYNAMLTQTGKVITPQMTKQQLVCAVILFLFALGVLVGIFVVNLGILSKIVELMLMVSLFFEIRTRVNQMKNQK
ncbi:hypothetical protein ROU88_08425 [Macrococcus capreoli]|uniref:hypothetical protein n=1 Tax=Macrococcus capreoli TaxID=2982690 RepID=UPI0021D5A84D|nr:hypothetical protein [Macrococcus sp. TMW 2.2395]MCU7558608.1 hypothetical protein [Macrococcus sp. TMW 2.2395]